MKFFKKWKQKKSADKSKVEAACSGSKNGTPLKDLTDGEIDMTYTYIAKRHVVLERVCIPNGPQGYWEIEIPKEIQTKEELLAYLGQRKPRTLREENFLFRGAGTIDVTNIETPSPESPIGYLCGGIVSVFQDGRITIRAIEDESKLLESFSVSDIEIAYANVHNHDPQYRLAVKVITKSKEMVIEFLTAESKTDFLKAICKE